MMYLIYRFFQFLSIIITIGIPHATYGMHPKTIDAREVNYAIAKYLARSGNNVLANNALTHYNIFMQQHKQLTITDIKDINISLLAKLQNITQESYQLGLAEEINYCKKLQNQLLKK